MPTEILSTDDAHLLDADPDLPGLAVLLDDAVLAEFLRRRNPAVHSAHAQYLRYKPGTALVAAVHLRTADGDRLALAQAVTRAGRPKLDKLARSAKDRRTWCHLDDSLFLAVADAGADRHLPGLHRELSRAGTRTVRYKPARRWVGRRTCRSGPELIKVFDADQGVHGAVVARTLATLGIPGPILLTERSHRRTLTFAWTEGTTLERQQEPDLTTAGALLARLHQVDWPHPDRPGRPWHSDLGMDSTGLADLARVVPGLREPARHAARTIARAGELIHTGFPAADTLVTSHGDFSADQMLAEPDGTIRLLDLDSVVRAPREYDLGEFLGEHLARTCSTDPSPAATEETIRAGLTQHAALVSGYEHYSGTSPDPARVLALASCAVLKRAAEPFRWRQPHWLHATRARVELAAVLAERARSLG
ncbi:hypothetical protein ACO0LV_11720 [Pseudactinotalea sp. Z1739]|uniref:hypothetical protein n=1 Tax=Pseudactinotalea sp. Z1739 TaxID=3413028 RepID=UPI003C7E3E37